MEICLATDHAGFKLKEAVKKFLDDSGYKIRDFGALEYDNSDDYPDFIKLAAEHVSKNSQDKAVIFGGSGQGEAIVANRFRGVRAAVLYSMNDDIIKLSREHNDANILSLGARFLTDEEAVKAVELWLSVGFTDEARHKRRIQKIDAIDI